MLDEGLFSGGTVIGAQTVSSGGTARNVAVNSGGAQIILAGGTASRCSAGAGGVQHLSGGAAAGTVVRTGGAQRVSAGGSAAGTVVSARGSQIVSSGGYVSGTQTLSGGSQHVRNGGSAVKTAVSKGGSQLVSSGGSALSTAVASGGSVFVYKGAKTSALTVGSGGSAILYGGALSGVNGFLGASVTVASAGVRINRIQADASTSLVYDVRKVVAGASSAMLTESVLQDLSCSFSVNAGVAQQTGSYRLSYRLDLQDGTEFGVSLDGAVLGSAALNGGTLSKHGVTYAVKSDVAGHVVLTLSARAGAMRKASSAGGTLSGTDDSDVFCGGSGDDVVQGVHGRNVAVYGTEAWGRDVVKATSGTMTLLFKNLSAGDVVQSLSGTAMTFAKKADASQSVTVEGWSDATHSVVFGGATAAFDKWLKASAPTAAQAVAARKEVWQKAGLAQA